MIQTKIKHINQRDCMQCGAACITMIARSYGKDYSLSHVSSICQPQRHGVTLRVLDNTLRELGFDTLACTLSIDSLCENFPGPCILHWNNNHFVVLYRIKDKSKFYIDDPGVGKYVCSRHNFKKHWVTQQNPPSGIALLLEPGPRFLDIKPEAHEQKLKSWDTLKRHITTQKSALAKILTFLGICSILQFIMPFLMQEIVDTGIKHSNIGLIWLILAGELMIVAGKTITDFIRRRILLKVSTNLNISLISEFFIKLLKLPMSFFETRLIGDLLQRIYDHRRVQNFLTAEMMAMVLSSIMLLVFSGVLAYYDLTVFLVFSAGSLLYAVWIFSFLHKRKILDYELFSLEARNQSALHQFVTSTQEIKLQGCEERRCKEWRNTQDTLFDVQYKRLRLTQSQEAGSIVINEMKNILITAITATSVVSGGISMGTMLAIQYIIGQLNVPIEQLMNFIYSAQDVNISLERINEIHESKEENFEHVGLKSLKGGQSIKLSNVCFKYNPHSKNEIIKNITTEIKQGEITAIVGASGSGKSTLIKLMLGFYSVGNGSIFIGNNTIDDYDLKWLRSRCGVVMQEGYIFSDTIARNIAMSEGKINLKKLDEAARIANIHDFIDNLPFRYDTKIGQDGLTLSKGQQQRILIARAVYKNPNYIFLDEATNALDAENENVIVKNLWRFYQGRTVVIVAHRLSTVKNADKIIVLDQGRIAETGTHQTLTANKGLYYNLVKNQLELDQ